MRTTYVHLIILVVALLTLAGCSVASDLRGQVRRDGRLLSPSPAATTVPAVTTTVPAAPALSATTPTPASSAVSAAPTATSSNDPTQAAIKALIQRANDEQQEAFTKQDPTVMKDTATSGYYDELVQTNRDLSNGGVAAIKLVKLEWGPITVRGTTAQATTFETWRTSYVDGSTDESRDRNVYTLVQQQGAWKIQIDAQPDTGLDQPPGDASPVPPGQSPLPPRILPGGSGQSDNWSGYAATNGTFTGVAGTWTVPKSSNNGNFSSGATWVGIGGVRSRDLIQAGTEETNSGSGQVRYDAWIETLPQASRRVTLAVSPGDSVSVSIAEQGTDQWLISFKNNTTGKSYQTTVQYSSSLSSAEWVEEAPSARRRLLPLDDFGTVQFSAGSATENGKKVTIAQAGGKPITMIDLNGDAIATPSTLSTDGSGFSISRNTPSPSTQPTQPRPGRGGFRSRPGGFFNTAFRAPAR